METLQNTTQPPQNSNFLAQILKYPELSQAIEEEYKDFIIKEGIFEPYDPNNRSSNPDKNFICFKPLRYLIENNFVTQDKNGDWILIDYNEGTSNESLFHHWMNTGYKTNWDITKWKQDTDLDESHSFYFVASKEGYIRSNLDIILNNHHYERNTYPNGFWAETVRRTDICDAWGKEQLYYGDAFGATQGKIPVKIGKKIQEIKNKGIEFGFYKF